MPTVGSRGVEATGDTSSVSEHWPNVAESHADASRVWIAVADTGRVICAIDVLDDGDGGARLDGAPACEGSRPCRGWGGRIDVRGEPGAGSTVHAEIPCASR